MSKSPSQIHSSMGNSLLLFPPKQVKTQTLIHHQASSAALPAFASLRRIGPYASVARALHLTPCIADRE
jgi:hypothetical protein